MLRRGVLFTNASRWGTNKDLWTNKIRCKRACEIYPFNQKTGKLLCQVLGILKKKKKKEVLGGKTDTGQKF